MVGVVVAVAVVVGVGVGVAVAVAVGVGVVVAVAVGVGVAVAVGVGVGVNCRSMSGLAALPHCRYGYRPDVMARWPVQEAQEAAIYGNAGHAFAERWIRNHCGLEPISPENEALIRSYEKDADFRKTTDRMTVWLEKNARLGWRPETPLAWSYLHDTARVLPSEYHRDYRDVKPGEVPGTLDVLSMDASCVDITDFKTGITVAAHYEWQMNIAAVAGARLTGATEARTRLVYFWPDAEPLEVVKTYDVMELDAIAYALQGWLLEADNDAPEPKPGWWCGAEYCHARGICPETMKLLQQAAPSVDIAQLAVAAIQTPEDAGRAYLQLKVINEACRVIRDRVQYVVENIGQAPTAHGKVLAVSKEGKETFSKPRLLEAGERGKALLEELKALGAIQKSEPKPVMREIKPK